MKKWILLVLLYTGNLMQGMESGGTVQPTVQQAEFPIPAEEGCFFGCCSPASTQAFIKRNYLMVASIAYVAIYYGWQFTILAQGIESLQK